MGTSRTLHQADFCQIMSSLPEAVLEEEIEEMFTFADTNGDGKLSYQVVWFDSEGS